MITPFAAVVLCGIALAVWVGLCVIAYRKGRADGRDQEWVDGIIRAARRQKQRRDERGRFRRCRLVCGRNEATEAKP